MSVPANLSGLPSDMKLSPVEQNVLRKRCGSMICAFFGFDSHSLTIYGTSYGLSIDAVRGSSPLFHAVRALLDKNGVKYSVACGSLHDEIRVSSRGDNLEKFKKLAEECWAHVEKTEGVLMNRYLELARSIDRKPGKCRYPHMNSVCRVLDLAEERVAYFRTYRSWFDVSSEIKTLEALLAIQNDVEACRDVLRKWKEAPLGEKTVSVRTVVLAEAELERLTGERPE